MIAIDLSKQQALDAEPKVIQQINFTINVDRRGNTIILLEEEKKKKLLVFRKYVIEFSSI